MKEQLHVTIGEESVSLLLHGSGDYVYFPLPQGAFGDGGLMARPAAVWLGERLKRHNRSVCTITVNTGQTAIRLCVLSNNDKKTSQRIIHEKIAKCFPSTDHFNDKTHTFGYDIIGGTLFMAAFPKGLSDSLMQMCREWGFGTRAIKRIGTVEHMLTRLYCEKYNASLIIIIPQGQGIRLIFISENRPTGVYFISNDPEYRLAELDRVFLIRCPVPERELAVITKGFGGVGWMKDYFANMDIILIEDKTLGRDIHE